MSNYIKIKSGSGAPTTLREAELGIDLESFKLYIGDADGEVHEISGGGGAPVTDDHINALIDAKVNPIIMELEEIL